MRYFTADSRQPTAGSNGRSDPSPAARRLLPARGFTVIELLVVIGVIVLALGLAVPALNALTGSNGTSSAANQVAAMLGRARSEAIGFQEIRGIFFYPDQTTGRYVATLVHVPDIAQYSSAVSYSAGQYVTYNGKYYICLLDAPTVAPSDSASDAYWRRTYDSTVIDSITEEDSFTLAANVGVQVVCDSRITGSPATKTSDNYLRCGAILFDPSGNLLLNHQISICSGGAIGKRMGLFNTSNLYYYPDPSSKCITTAGFPYESSCGFVLYDRDALTAQSFYSENDYWVLDPRFATDSKYTAPTFANELSISTSSTPGSEEDWLDKNGQVFLVNRYNGSLIKGQ